MAQMTDSLAQAILDGAGVTRHELEQLARRWLNTRADSGEAVSSDEPKDDRAMLLYLMQAFDSESWQCPKCGHDEDTATMDSAYFLRGYLIANPSSTAVDVNAAYTRGRSDGWDACNADENRDAARWRQFAEMIDPDLCPGGFTIYYATEKGMDQLCYHEDLIEHVDAAIAIREGS